MATRAAAAAKPKKKAKARVTGLAFAGGVIFALEASRIELIPL